MAKTTKGGEVKMLFSALPNLFTAGDRVCGGIKFFKVDVDIAECYRVHSTADVHTDHIGNNLVNYRHCSTYSTAFSCVYVGHNSYFGVLESLLVTDRLDLLFCRIVKRVCITYSGVIGTVNYNHDKTLSA